MIRTLGYVNSNTLYWVNILIIYLKGMLVGKRRCFEDEPNEV